MDKAQANFEKILNSPNINTKSLSQIHQSDEIVQAQITKLRALSKQNRSSIHQYEKLINKTLQKTGNALDYERVQRFAESCDQTLRILENTTKIIESNENLSYTSK